jgi:hypothetical protein
MAYPDDEERLQLKKLSEALKKSQSQIILDLIREKFSALFGTQMP